jgi:iron complex transport system substrate-binding protein
LSSCGQGAPPPSRGETRIFEDDLGRDVEVPLKPRRIVCTSPEITEILFAVGAGDRVVGVVRGCDWPPPARELPLVGDFSNVSLERVVALRPDLIITTGHEQERMLAQLERLDIPVVAFLAKDFASVRRNAVAVASLVGEEKNGAALVAKLDRELAAVETAVDAIPAGQRPRVFLEISPEPLMTVAKGSFVDEAIAFAGGVNVGVELPRPYSRIDPEAVITADPQVIVLCHGSGTPAAVGARTGWGRISAVREGRVYGVNPDIVLRAGPRLGEGVAALHALFYEEQERKAAGN